MKQLKDINLELKNRKIMGANIDKYITLNNLTRFEFIEKINKAFPSENGKTNFKYSTLSEWINGNAYPRIDKIEMMALFFNINKTDLIEEKQKKKNEIPSINITLSKDFDTLSENEKKNTIELINSLVNNVVDNKIKEKLEKKEI